MHWGYCKQRSKDIPKLTWSDKATKLLIVQWKKHKCLYNSKHRSYQNSDMRQRSLIDISVRLKHLMPRVTPEHVERKLKGLRTSYAKAIKNPSQPKPWKWSKHMGFLKRCMRLAKGQAKGLTHCGQSQPDFSSLREKPGGGQDWFEDGGLEEGTSSTSSVQTVLDGPAFCFDHGHLLTETPSSSKLSEGKDPLLADPRDNSKSISLHKSFPLYPKMSQAESNPQTKQLGKVDLTSVENILLPPSENNMEDYSPKAMDKSVGIPKISGNPMELDNPFGLYVASELSKLPQSFRLEATNKIFSILMEYQKKQF